MSSDHDGIRDITEKLAGLALFNNDPGLLPALLPDAEAGNVHAQYAVGLIYAEGRGVAENPVQAYIWLSRAMAQGDNDAADLRRMLALSMNSGDIILAERILGEETSK